jgi:hypothetical protein
MCEQSIEHTLHNDSNIVGKQITLSPLVKLSTSISTSDLKPRVFPRSFGQGTP